MTERQRRMGFKASLLDTLSQTARSWDIAEEIATIEYHDLSLADSLEVQEELASQLYAWAVRITPHGPVG